MVRKGRHKYIYIHGHEGQLFDLEADPNEWENLVGRPEHQEVVEELRALILSRFDPEEVDARLRRNITHRRLIQRAMLKTDTSWDVSPVFDRRGTAYTQYEPGHVE
jgi:choline-sulfatase